MSDNPAPDNSKRTAKLEVRVTPAEKELVERVAAERGIGYSELLRQIVATVIGRPVRVGPVKRTEGRTDRATTLEHRVRQLRAQGLTTPVARRQAEGELG